ncbi:MAG: GNAT family N-acetyltransferase [Alphaproteobacteria bacterium]
MLVYSSLDDLSSRDIALVSYDNRRSLFSSIEWFRCLAQHGLPDDTEIRIYVAAGDGEADEKCFLFCASKAGTRALSSLSNFYTMEFCPIFSSDRCDKSGLLNEICRYIAREEPRWHSVNLKLLIADKDHTGLLRAALAASGFRLNEYFQFENFYTETKGMDFHEYYNLRPSRVRNTIKRKEKKLSRAHEFSVRVFPGYDDDAIDDYAKVYARSWKDSEQFPNFIRELCRLASRLGILRMGILSVDGQATAAQIWLLSGRKAIIYKLAYDEAYGEFSVGSILTREMAQYILEHDRVEEIDYGVGSEPYKKEWMDRKNDLIGIEAFSGKTLRGNLLTARSLAARMARKFRA